jgi:hypothetical protein
MNDRKKEFEEQKALLDYQKFESIFFNMLNQINIIISNYTFIEKNGKQCNGIKPDGASFFTYELVNLWRHFGEEKTDPKSISSYFEKTQINIEFKNFVLHIANIMRIILSSKIDQENKYTYYKILIGFLTNRQKYFIELCSNSTEFSDEEEYLKFIHRSTDKWIQFMETSSV